MLVTQKFKTTYIRTIRNTCTNNDGSIDKLVGDERCQFPRGRFTNVSTEGTTITNFGIVEVINLCRTQEVLIFDIRRKGEWHTL